MNKSSVKTSKKSKTKKLTLARIIKYLVVYKWRLLAVFVLGIIGVFTNLMSTFMMKPLIDNVIAPVSGVGDIKLLSIIIAIMMGSYLVSVICGLIQVRLMVHVAQHVIENMKNDLFNKLQNLPIRYFDTNTHGDIMSRFTNDLDLVADFLNGTIIQIFTSAVLFIGLLCFMLPLSWILTLVACFFLPIIVLLISHFVKKARYHFSCTQKYIGQLEGYLEETLEGQKIVKVFNHEEVCKKEFEVINNNVYQNSVRGQFFSSLAFPLVNNLNNLNYVVCAAIGCWMVFGFAEPLITTGTLLAFIAFCRQFTRPISEISNQMNMIQEALAGAERVFQIIDSEPENLGTTTVISVKKDNGDYVFKDGDVEIPVRGDVRFHNVTFGYNPGQVVLNDISLYAKPGQKIAFVGSTGAGKTTITNLLTRFYDITEGQITIDGIDIKKIERKSLRKSMTMVLQDTSLFTGTIMENIRYGRLKATDEDVYNAAKLARADEFIQKLPNGYQTKIHGSGNSLSQGQRQLLSIARSAIANPPILILDEATSSIDTRTEKFIQEGMDELMKNKTTFVIAHRLSTIRNANAIIVLEHGKIKERGTHRDLLKAKGRYFELYTGTTELE